MLLRICVGTLFASSARFFLLPVVENLHDFIFQVALFPSEFQLLPPPRAVVAVD